MEENNIYPKMNFSVEHVNMVSSTGKIQCESFKFTWTILIEGEEKKYIEFLLAYEGQEFPTPDEINNSRKGAKLYFEEIRDEIRNDKACEVLIKPLAEKTIEILIKNGHLTEEEVREYFVSRHKLPGGFTSSELEEINKHFDKARDDIRRKIKEDIKEYVERTKERLDQMMSRGGSYDGRKEENIPD